MNPETSGRSVSLSAYDRLLLAFSNLRSYGIDAVIGEGDDPEMEMDRLQAELRRQYPEATGCCLVAMRRDLDCFTPEGHLFKPLLVHQRGVEVKSATRAALREYDLDTCELDGESRLLVFDAHAGGPEVEPASPLAGLEK